MSSRTVPGAALAAGEVVAARAVTAPDGPALTVEGGDDLTYADWDVRSNAVARGLAARGVGAGDRVGLLFDGRGWADFAVAHLGVLKAGGVAVLLSPAAAGPDLLRALSHSGATGLLGLPHLVPPGASQWAAHPDEVGRGHDTSSVAPAVDPAAPAELIYPSAPLAPAPPEVRAHRDVVGENGPGVDGWLVHAWAPGSLAGRRAIATLLAPSGGATGAATLAVFDPDRFCALAVRRRASTLGLSPGLAAALVASGALSRHDLSSVRHVVLSTPPTPALRAGLEAAFPGVPMTQSEGPGRPPSATGEPGPAPVAVSQEGMLWHEQFAPGSFNLPCLVRRYDGPLDVASLEWALSELVRRHQPLRSTFALVDGDPCQVVGDDRPRPLPLRDLSALTPQDRDAEVAGILADATSRPFDLATGPLFEPRLVRLGTDGHLLVVRLHHTVFDDWSVDVFRRELSALYGARRAGAPSPLVEPEVSFSDFCRRQRARLAGAAGAEERSWWRRELDGAPLAVQLPIGPDGAEPAGSRAGEPVRLDLPPTLAAGLRALGPRLRATPYMTVLSAFSVLLARATGQEDLLIATVVAHRNRSDVEPLVGCFTKKVPLRLRVDGDPTFPELVARTRRSLLGALSHQGLAFDAAVHEALGTAAAAHGVVPQVAVVFQGETPQRVKLALPGLVTRPYQPPEGARRERHFSAGPEKPAGRADGPVWGDGIYLGTFLILSLLETQDGMALVARGVFSRPAVRRLLDGLQSLLADVVDDPSRPVAELGDGSPLRSDPTEDVVDLRGFRARRSRLEAGLGRCPGVRDVAVAVRDAGGEPRLIAYVVPAGDRAPTLAELRQALWAGLPGALWPAEVVVVDRLDRGVLPPPRPAGRSDAGEPEPDAALVAAMWGELSGRPVAPDLSYWQDFSFLPVLAEAREAGLALEDEHVVRCRTPEMLVAAAAGARHPRQG